ncbi:MAG: toll/interleukin-1 receptor domain-containing protein, partial [Cyanobacteria bacterium P01_A01_bin.37]
MSNLYDIFISYGRPDSREFAIKLCNRLTALNYRVWFDVNDIPAGVDYQKHIDDGIEKSHNLLFIISPHSVNSDYCRLEIEQAIQFNKRIIPVFHVSSIDQATWKQRNPEKPDEDWDMIKACNMHRGDDKNPNMHPVIAEINWFPSTSKNVECNFDEFIAELDEALHLHDDYLEKHTEYLVLALQWERNQRQSRYLLFQENRYDAEKWLKRRFADPHPRYVPTDLHCEYITESKKNAQNLMTQVFLAHASEDEPTMHMIRRSLQREGITVWVSSTDIQSGEDFRSAINRGIEQADTVVYLLSPDSQSSEYCRHELEYALSLNKRVIPILICPTEPELIPDELQSLQYIDLTKDRDAIAYQNENARLIKVLNEDASYFEAHKIFLSQAIKWEQGDCNPSMLLQGYNLTHAITWHKTAQLRSQYQPTPLQDEFIRMSQRQPPAQALDVFISYSRSDSDIARRLNEQLQRAGKRTWFDQESIASGANFQQEIYRGIENSDNFLFIISPRSIASPYCADEVEYAAKHNKRIVTLLHRQIDANDLHSTLKEIQWIDFENNRSDFSAGFNELIGTLDNDPQHLHTHTRLLVKALEWDTQGRSDCFLLHGEEIDHAEHWLNQSETKEPLPTGLQRDFVNSSRAAAQAQQRAQQVLKDAVKEGKRRVLLGTITMGVALAIAGITSIQTIQASGKLRLFNTFEELESAADHAMRQSEFDQIGSMVTAVEAAHELHTIANRQNLPDFADYETLRPFLALQQNLYPTGQRFVEQNRFDLMGSSTTA